MSKAMKVMAHCAVIDACLIELNIEALLRCTGRFGEGISDEMGRECLWAYREHVLCMELREMQPVEKKL